MSLTTDMRRCSVWSLLEWLLSLRGGSYFFACFEFVGMLLIARNNLNFCLCVEFEVELEPVEKSLSIIDNARMDQVRVTVGGVELATSPIEVHLRPSAPPSRMVAMLVLIRNEHVFLSCSTFFPPAEMCEREAPH